MTRPLSDSEAEVVEAMLAGARMSAGSEGVKLQTDGGDLDVGHATFEDLHILGAIEEGEALDEGHREYCLTDLGKTLRSITVYRCPDCEFTARSLPMFDEHSERAHGRVIDVEPEEVKWVDKQPQNH